MHGPRRDQKGFGWRRSLSLNGLRVFGMIASDYRGEGVTIVKHTRVQSMEWGEVGRMDEHDEQGKRMFYTFASDVKD